MANAPVDLTTVATLKARLGLVESVVSRADESELARLVTEVSQRMHNEIGGSVIYRPRVDTKDGNGGRRVWLDDGTPPAAEESWSCLVSTVTVDGVPVPESVSGSDGWTSTDGSRVDLVGYSYAFTKGAGNVVITYSAGFKADPWSIPSDIEGAVVEVAALKWKEKDRIGQTSKIIGGENINFQGSNVWATFMAVAAAYHRVVI